MPVALHGMPRPSHPVGIATHGRNAPGRDFISLTVNGRAEADGRRRGPTNTGRTMTTDLDLFLSEDGRQEAIGEVRRQIDAAGVTYLYCQFVSVTGRVMGKGVPAPHWETVAAQGFQLVYGATANLFIDRRGDYIGYGPEARELVGIPEPETFAVLPWDRKVARVFC